MWLEAFGENSVEDIGNNVFTIVVNVLELDSITIAVYKCII